MRYCPEIKTPALNKIHSLLWKDSIEKILIPEDGLYKYINDNLYKFKIIPSTTSDLKPFTVQSTQIFPVGYNFHTNNEVTQIPPQHHFIALHKKMYKLNPKSTTVFTVEYINSEVKDFYFESPEQFDNHSLQEDIISFLSLLK